MPEFSPFAGFSPNCEAVFVQIEHCACTLLTVAKEKNKTTANIIRHFSIVRIFTAKIQLKMVQTCYLSPCDGFIKIFILSRKPVLLLNNCCVALLYFLYCNK